MSGVLEGIRVLDFGRYIAGPYCACLLGDLGADVIRVEKRSGSEDRWTSPVAEGGEGSLFMQVNRNKRGITLSLGSDAGREVVRRLVERTDVVVANLPPQTLEAMGLDYPTLCETKPDIILTTVSAYGHGGPWSHRVGFDGVAQAMSGAMYLTGYPDEPMRLYYPWVDFQTATLCAFGTLAALMERQRDRARPAGRGLAARLRAHGGERHAHRAGGHRGGPRRHREPRADRRALRLLPHQGRLGARHGDRPAALRALGRAHG
jgi:crotonobetainyl-CoA:carnitine CoA-transferase CaiB-like acyl-CoA transferase